MTFFLLFCRKALTGTAIQASGSNFRPRLPMHHHLSSADSHHNEEEEGVDVVGLDSSDSTYSHHSK